jgi:hypothetical protein
MDGAACRCCTCSMKACLEVARGVAPEGADKLRDVVPTDKAAFGQMLDEFSSWYNAVGPHQNLGGLTPLVVWNGLCRPQAANALAALVGGVGWSAGRV